MPAAPLAGVPEMVAVRVRLSVNRIPEGNRPVLLMAGAGMPVVVTVKVDGLPNAACVGGAAGKGG